MTLRGRDAQLRALDAVLDAVRAGESRVLVVRGEPGVGKSALLDYVGERASGCRVARAVGVQAEMELAFAGLHLLCAQMLDHLEGLPGPQRDALRTAFGLSAGPAPDPFLVALAALSLLSEVAQERPLVCLVDDAQWLDRASAQALAFVARRLRMDPVALIFAARDKKELTGLPELVVEGLGRSDARGLLLSALGAPLDEQVRDRIVAETRGNPLALLELPRGLSPAQLAGGFGLPDALPLSRRIEESFRRRLAALGADGRRLLLVAAAEPIGDPILVWGAAERLGVAADAAVEVESAGLCEFGPRVRFRHPLVRSAVYQAASPEERRTVHRALAEATDPETDPDRRVWHRAQAAAGLDEEIAAELERSAVRAQARGGASAAAAFLERAAALSASPAGRAARALGAAHAKYQAGAFDEAQGLVAAAQAGPLDELQRARTEQLLAQIAFASVRGRESPPLLLRAARRLEPLDAGLARETLLEAFTAALFVGHLGSGESMLAIAQAARAVPAPERSRPPDLLLDGLARLGTDGFTDAVPALRRALREFRREDVSTETGLRWLWLAGHAGAVLWDFATWRAFAVRHLQMVRDAGALSALPIALTTRAGAHMLAGELAEAESLIGETATIAEAMGAVVAYFAAPLAALQGREAEAAKLIESGAAEALARGEGLALTSLRYSAAVLYNGLGRYDDALDALEQSAEHPAELWRYILLPEHIEAAVRSGRPGRAEEVLERLTERTRASATDWALGIEARSRALVSDGEPAERLYRDAIDRLGRSGVRIELVRAELLYGEWLRRERRRLDARERLRTAQDTFAAMGMNAFADRAERELAATGATARKRSDPPDRQLTSQEAQIARLAVEGLSNPEIGARLFISPRTVQYHLGKVFFKLDISSRHQLHRALS
jgi:DNA-binding CsgD family transcriptional regulator